MGRGDWPMTDGVEWLNLSVSALPIEDEPALIVARDSMEELEEVR